ncbi:MAG: hypothetical protein H6945_18465 [Zoogloeaceae bacterium]|nr:hypothetical protein [Rhodocyclaceae bacterium]MCP5237721.1 hypothetical protein [Zoogloeaceae bacterium]
MTDPGRLRFDLFGRPIEVVREGGRWRVFYLGNEGKRRPAADIEIPSEVTADTLEGWLDDMFHEYATAARSRVRRL